MNNLEKQINKLEERLNLQEAIILAFGEIVGSILPSVGVELGKLGELWDKEEDKIDAKYS